MAETTLDDDHTKPARTEPGDGPADTTDPRERATTVVPQPGPEALKAGTVNGIHVLDPIPEPPSGRRVKNARVEEYDATDQFGNAVRMERNIETGESRVKQSTDTGSTPTQSAAAGR